jgi:tetratricopeptide (TPR) repeat protein
LLTVAFARCIAQCDEDPDRFPIDNILWEYRWVCTELLDFPDVPLTQINDLLDETTRRYKVAGSTMRAVNLLKMRISINIGDPKSAMKHFKAFRKCQRDWLSDDEITEATFYFDCLVLQKKYQEAIELGRRAIVAGDLHHNGSVYADLLNCYMMLDDLESAKECHRKGYRLVSENPRYVNSVGKHVAYLALTNQFPRGVTLFNRHFAVAMSAVSEDFQYMFYSCAMLLFERLSRKANKPLRLNVPNQAAFYDDSGRYVPSNVYDWLVAESRRIADRFDTRNGNPSYGKRLKEIAKRSKATPLDS